MLKWQAADCDGVHSTRGEQFYKGVRLFLITVPTMLKSTKGLSGVE